jgi:transcriptional regulator with XRE-family HTH domain
MGCRSAYLSGLEKGERNPTVVTLWHLAKALGVRFRRQHAANNVGRQSATSPLRTPSSVRRGAAQRFQRSTRSFFLSGRTCQNASTRSCDDFRGIPIHIGHIGSVSDRARAEIKAFFIGVNRAPSWVFGSGRPLDCFLKCNKHEPVADEIVGK